MGMSHDAPQAAPAPISAGCLPAFGGGEMDYTAILTLASQATADTLPQALQAVFSAMCAATLLDTEIEAILQALRKAAGISIQALRSDWKKFLATRNQQASPTVAPLPPDVEAEADSLLHDPALLYK